MSNIRVILLNGPPRSGKDTIGAAMRAILDRGTHAVVRKFAGALKDAAHRLYSVGPGVGHDWFEAVKDESCSQFFGRTPREVYIAVSEKLMKPLHGDRIFGRLLVDEIKRTQVVEFDEDTDLVVVVTDSGFAPEAQELIDAFGIDNVSLVRITRKGASFDGDSRSYIHLPIRTVTIRNEGPIESVPDLALRTLLDIGFFV